MTLGMRAGAIVLIAAAVIVLSLITRFALRLWRLSARGADGAEVHR